MLRFEVQGSAKAPYRVSFEGSGPTMRAFCTCPGGNRGGKFCKHVAAVLRGDVKVVVSGAEQFAALMEASRGSDLVSQAASHVPSKPKEAPSCGMTTLAEVASAYAPRLKAAGFACVIEDQDNEAIALVVGVPFKNGGIRKGGQIVLSHEPWTEKETVDGEGWPITALIPSSKLWRLKTSGGKRAYATLDRLVYEFDLLIADLAPA